MRRARLLAACRLNRHEAAGREATAFLQDFGAELGEVEVAELRMTVATGLIVAGKKETACAIYRELLAKPEVLGSSNRGWAYRNMSLALPAQHTDARRFAEISADAFLEAGQRGEASKSLMRVANCLLFEDPAAALKALDRVVAWFDQNEPASRDFLAGVLHARAERLSKLGRHAEAVSDAKRAAELRTGLLGVEAERASSLYLAGLEADAAGMPEEATSFQRRADELVAEIRDPELQFAAKVKELISSFERARADELLAEAELNGQHEAAAHVQVLIGTQDPCLDHTARIHLFEEALKGLEAHTATEDAQQPALFAIAWELSETGEKERALPWYKRILAHNPLDAAAGQNYVAILWELKRWEEAATFVADLVGRFGEKPVRLYALGRSLFEAGRRNEAVTPLHKAVKLAHPDEAVSKHARKYLDMALDQGAVPPPPAAPAADAAPVTTAEFEGALEAFAAFVQAEKRMRFWTRKARKHAWVERPERQAQDLLHTFLRARLGDRVQLFEELASGAGRLDLFVVLHGGLSVIVELKMCGAGYSGSYALEGLEQVLHYMVARDKNLGYLVIFDARISDFGTGIESMTVTGKRTVMTKFVDVRSTVKSR